MIRKLVFIALLSLAWFYSGASQDFVWTISSKNVSVLYENYDYNGSISYSKAYALSKYLSKLNKLYFSDSAYIFVAINVNETHYGSKVILEMPKYMLGYYDCIFDINYPIYPDKEVSKKAIALRLQDPNFSINEILNIVYYGLKNVSQIKERQSGQFLYYPYYYEDSLLPFKKVTQSYSISSDAGLFGAYAMHKTVPRKMIDSIIKLEQPIDFDRITNGKFNSDWLHSTFNNGVLDYYFQGDSFYIYKRSPLEKRPFYRSWEMKEMMSPNVPGEYICRFKKLNYIITDSVDNYFFCFDDTMMCYYNVSKKQWSKPVRLHVDNMGFALYPREMKVSKDSRYIKLSVSSYQSMYQMWFDIKDELLTFDYRDSWSREPYWQKKIEEMKADLGLQKALLDNELHFKRKERTPFILIAYSVIVLASIFLACTKRL